MAEQQEPETVYVYHLSKAGVPRLLVFNEDGSSWAKETLCPNVVDSSSLEVLCHSWNLVLFRHTEQLLLWHVEREKVIDSIDLTYDGLASSFGIGRTENGVKIVQLLRPALKEHGRYTEKVRIHNSNRNLNQWSTSTRTTEQPFLVDLECGGVSLNTCVYFTGKVKVSVSAEMTTRKKIFVYNAETEIFSTLAFPDSNNGIRLAHGPRGHLCACEIKNSSQLILWSLGEDQIWSPIAYLSFKTCIWSSMIPIFLLRGREHHLLNMVFIKDEKEIVWLAYRTNDGTFSSKTIYSSTDPLVASAVGSSSSIFVLRPNRGLKRRLDREENNPRKSRPGLSFDEED